MKLISMLLLCFTPTICSAQSSSNSVENPMGIASIKVLCMYDSNGNMVSRHHQYNEAVDNNNHMFENTDSIAFEYVGNNKLNVQTFTEEPNTKQVRVYNANTNILLSDEFTDDTYPIDMNSYPNGLYIIEAETKNSMQSTTVLKK